MLPPPPPSWCMALTGLRAAKKPSAVGSGDISREAADTALHGSTPSLPLLLLPQRAEGDFFPVPPGHRRRAVPGAHLAGGQKVALQATWEDPAESDMLLDPLEGVFFPRVGKV